MITCSSAQKGGKLLLFRSMRGGAQGYEIGLSASIRSITLLASSSVPGTTFLIFIPSFIASGLTLNVK